MNETILISIDQICPNPWQPREHEEPEHIKDLALSIARNGLMHNPMGRWVFPEGRAVTGMGSGDLTTHGLKVQLAFGHSRLAAFRWLEDVKGSSNLEGDWSRIPVTIREIDDEQMAIWTIEENVQRKNLNAIEEARAMARLRDEFGKNSNEIGDIFGLKDSTVRNKLRLLNLPETIQNDLRSGLITEGIGRALIPLYDIPEAARLDAEDGDDLKPSEIIEAARSGISPERVSEMVNRLARRINPQTAQIALPIAESAQQAAFSGQPEEKPVVEPVLAPKPEPLPIPAVSVETVDETGDEINQLEGEDDDEIEDSPSPDLMDQGKEDEEIEDKPEEREFAPVKPHMTPVRSPEPAQPAATAPAPAPVARPAPQPAPVAAVQPPAPAPIATVPWEKSTILLSLTLWPEDGQPGGRMVSMGARANQGIPLMASARMDELELPAQMQNLLNHLHQIALDAIEIGAKK